MQLRCPNSQWAELTRELLTSRTALRLRLRGSSMYPVIHNHDIAHIWPVLPQDIRPGAIVFYVNDEQPVVHRVVRKRCHDGRLDFWICSDFYGTGHWIPADRVYGSVIMVERNGQIYSMHGWRGQLWGWVFSRLWCGLGAARRRLMQVINLRRADQGHVP